MFSMIQMVGVIVFAAMILVVVALGVVSWVKGGHGKGDDHEDGGLGIVSEGSTSGHRDGGSLGGP